MSSYLGKLWYGIGIDNSDLRRDARDATSVFSDITSSVETEAARIDKMWSKVGNSIKGALTITGITAYVKKMYEIRSAFQDTESSMETFLGSAEKASKFMKELQDYAWYNMFEFSDLTKESAKLLAFRNDVNDIIPILDKLSNVAAGTKKPLSDLVDLYNKAKSLGKVDAMGLQSWANNGVVIIDVLKDLGIEVDSSSVKFEHLQKVLNHVTSEGQMFGGLMEKQMNNLSASWGQLMDDIDVKFNELGQKYQNAMKSGIEFGSWLVSHYEEIISVLTVLIATYGAYRAALASTILLQKAQQFKEGIALIKLFRKELGLLTAAQQAFNIKAAMNPYILMATAITGACVAIWQLIKAENAKKQAIEDAVKPLRDEFTQTNLLVEKLKDANLKAEERRKILLKLKEINPEIVKDIKDEADAYEELSERLEQYNKTKLAEISLEKYAVENSFEKSANDLQEAREKLEKEQVNIQSTYITLFSRFRELETQNARLPESFKKLFNEIIDSSMPDEEKVKVLYEKYASIRKQLRHSVYMGNKDNPRDNMSNLFSGVSVSGLDKAINNLDKRTKEYEKKAEAFKVRIEHVAKVTHPDDLGLQKEFIRAEWIKHFPDEVDQIIDKAEDVTDKVRDWKDDLKDLVNEELHAKIDITTDIPEVIDLIQKEIKKEKDRVDNMKPLLIKAGFDFSAMAFPDGMTPSALQQQWSKEYTKSYTNLTGLTNAKNTLNIPTDKKGEDTFIKSIQTQIDLTKSAKQEYEKLLQFMSSGEAFEILKKTAGYGKIRLEDIISTNGENEGYIAYLEKEIQKLSVRKTKEAQTLVQKLQQELDGLKIENLYNSQVRTNAVAKLNKEFTKKITDQVKQSQFDIRQAEIDAMDQGFEQEKAQLKLNYDRLIAENDERQEEWLRQLRDNQKAKWLLDNPGKDESQFVSNVTVADLSAEQQQALQSYTDAANRYREKSESDLLDNLLIKYGDYNYQKIKIEEDFDKEINALLDQLNEHNASVIDGALREAQKQKDNALAELDASMQASTSLWAQLFDNYSSYTQKELREIINNAREVLEYINSTPDADIEAKFGLTAAQLRNLKSNATELTSVYDALQGKLDQLNRKNPFSAMISSAALLKKNTAELKKANDDLAKAQASGDKVAIKNASNRLKNLKNESGFLKGELKDSAMAATGYLMDVGGGLQEIGAAAGDAGIESFGKALSDLGGIAQSFMQGGPIAAGITAITTGLTAFFSSQAKYRAALKQMEDDRIAFLHEYKLAMSDIRLEAKELTNVFNEDLFAKAIVSLREMHDMYDDFIGAVNKKDTLQFGNGFFEQFRAKQKELKGITTDLENIWIQTRHKTWFRSAKGEYLKDMYPELFQGEYGFDVEAARALLNTNNQLNDEAKRQIQEVIDLFDQMEAAEQQFKDYLSQTFGDIGVGLSDAIVSAFEDGTDAMENWANSFNDVLKNLGKQMMQTIFFQRDFDRLEKELTEIYDNHGSDPNAVANKAQALLGNFFKGMAGTVSQAERWYENFAKEAEKYGFDLTGDSNNYQTATAKGFQAMSQDTGDELNGRFTSIQMTTIELKEMVGELKGLSLIGINHLANIEKNTSVLPEMADDVKSIKKQTAGL